MRGHPGASDIDAFCANYFTEAVRFATLRETATVTDDDWASRVLDRLIWAGEAEEAWPLVLAFIDRAPDDRLLAHVAAGPFEDLLRAHGEGLADRIIERARSDERFRRALTGMWGWEELPERVLLALHQLGFLAVRGDESRPLFVDLDVPQPG